MKEEKKWESDAVKEEGGKYKHLWVTGSKEIHVPLAHAAWFSPGEACTFGESCKLLITSLGEMFQIFGQRFTTIKQQSTGSALRTKLKTAMRSGLRQRQNLTTASASVKWAPTLSPYRPGGRFQAKRKYF